MINKELLKDRISAEGLTQKKIAQMLGMSKNTFSATINNDRPINTDEIEKLCNILNIKDDMAKIQIFLAEPSQK